MHGYVFHQNNLNIARCPREVLAIFKLWFFVNLSWWKRIILGS
ncbi:hypothetical protein CsSME_00041375 [Camellia sinensis var. sinensis]